LFYTFEDKASTVMLLFK